MKSNFKLWDQVLGWAVFAIAAATYLLTLEPTASFWDCGEFISSAWKLDVGHPPGAPFFMLMGHFASLFASDVQHVAMCVNALSGIASAFTILFLFWTITALGKKLALGKADRLDGEDANASNLSLVQQIGVLGAGVVGALAYTFSDTFWFSAVEGEVYASSSLFTAVVFWAILKWDEHADEEGSDRWLIFIAYMMGLSIGVHLLNLLTIPAIVLVYYFRRYKFSWGGAMTAFLASCAILLLILYGMIPGIPTLAGWFELLFVNVLGCSFNTGLAVYLVMLAAALVWAIYETNVEHSEVRMYASFALAFCLSGAPFLFESAFAGIVLTAALVAFFVWKKGLIPARILNTAAVMIAVIVVGYSSYAALVIRSNADTPMDQNSPDNVFSLKYYLNREQYGDRPLFYGQVYNAPVKLEVKGNMCIPVEKKGHAQYAPDPESETTGKDRYIITGYKSSYVYMDQFCMLFPRMYSPDQRHIGAYKSWGDVKGRKVKYDYCGQQKSDVCPTFGENLKFFFSYQVHWMYWRYFMWNFAGRQNELQGYGDVMKGNWVCGIPFIDNARLGDQSALPRELRENKGHNEYYMLPLVLGLIGIFYQLSRKKEGTMNFTLTFLLFFLTGLAIVLYLNQTPYQPRERDYAYAGSFYAYCIWIGLGVMALVDWLSGMVKNSQAAKSAIGVAVCIVCLGVPALMAQQNWDDHDRSDRYSCRDFGANYLKSCENNAIIFSNGDNDTFPLWYNQEVEEVGTDLRVCNLSYLQTDWYIDQLRRPYYDAEACPISWDKKDYLTGTNEVVWVQKRLPEMDVESAFRFVRSNDLKTKNNGENYLPTDKLYIPIDADKALGSESSFAGRYQPEQLADRLDIQVGRRLTKSEMMVLEMLSTNQWKRPMYFCVSVGNDYYQGLEPYFEMTGLAYQITPVASPDGQPRVNIEKMYDNMMHQFRYGNLNKEGIWIDENLMRMCRTHRMMFMQLAEALYNAGDRARCVEVLDYAEEVLPAYNVPYDYTSATMGVLYMQCGEREKAEHMFSIICENTSDYLAWFNQADREQRKSVESTIQHQAAVLNYVLQYAERYHMDELVETYYPALASAR
ncbi:MAG: DUF2723 domain-containing protein [Paludibacteraceae bacterium]|nr:DUF2723 domain-containing protein [Paludibacteraceae bacterium]